MVMDGYLCTSYGEVVSDTFFSKIRHIPSFWRVSAFYLIIYSMVYLSTLVLAKDCTKATTYSITSKDGVGRRKHYNEWPTLIND